jgi:hypothetical protein
LFSSTLFHGWDDGSASEKTRRFQLEMPSPTYDQDEYPAPCQADLKEYSPSITTNSIDTGSSIPSCKEGDIEFARSEDGLPPVDGGIQAWLFLIASSMLEALVWGELLLEYEVQDNEMEADRNRICFFVRNFPRLL